MNKTKEKKLMQYFDDFCKENDVHIGVRESMGHKTLQISDAYKAMLENDIYQFLFIDSINDVGSNYSRANKYVYSHELVTGFYSFLLDKKEHDMLEELFLFKCPRTRYTGHTITPLQYFDHVLRNVSFGDEMIEKIFFRPKILKILEKNLDVLYSSIKSDTLKLTLTDFIVELTAFTNPNYQANAYIVFKKNLSDVDFEGYKKFFDKIEHSQSTSIVNSCKSTGAVRVTIDLLKVNSILAKEGASVRNISEYTPIIEYVYNVITSSDDFLKLLGVSDIMIKKEKGSVSKERDIFYFGDELSVSFLEKFTTDYIMRCVKGKKDSNFIDSVNKSLELELLDYKIENKKIKLLKI